MSPAAGTWPARLRRLAGRRPLMLFFGLALAWSWGWWLAMLAAGLRVAPGLSASHLPGLLGPGVAALLVTAWADGWRGLGALARACLDPRGIPGIAWAVALAPLAIAVAVALVAGEASGPPPPGAWLALPGVPQEAPPAAAFLLILLAIGFGEEVGWRAFAFARLEARGRLEAAAVVGLLWMLWHLPLFFLNAGMAAMVGPMLAGWAVSILAGSILLGWLWLAAGARLWPVALFHALFDMATASAAATPPVASLASLPVIVGAVRIAQLWRRQQAPRLPPTNEGNRARGLHPEGEGER